jgi:hypothetical protein
VFHSLTLGSKSADFMKSSVLLPLFILVFFVSNAQQVKQLQFREELHDFGTILEEKGPVDHEFVFTNTSNRTVKVLNVQPSCGCTTPSWTKEAIAPGKTGFIQASFNPQGRPGYFNKSLTVTTDLEPNPIILQIKGQVSTDTDNTVDARGYDVVNGNLKFRYSSFNVGKVYHKDEYATREFAFINGGETAIAFSGKPVAPAHMKVEIIPSTVAPGGKGVIKVGYNGKLKGQYGFQSDNIELTTDDSENPVKSFTVLATIEDDFRGLSAEELKKAPQLKLSELSVDLGRLNPSTAVVREVQFVNTGKSMLEIKSVQGNCSCVKASTAKKILKPGESGSIKFEFAPQDRKGSHLKAVTVYSNDPRNPVQRFTLSAYVD